MSDALGYAASSAVLASFLMRSMVPLRLVAILSNLLFLSYGYFAQIQPVFVLHAALLPINVARLAALSGGGGSVWLSPNRYFASLNDGARYVALFVFGLMAGTLGIRAFIHVALAFVDQCRRSFV
jgi:hypothetical protein